MKLEKRKRLEAAGWRVSTVSEFLGLTDEETALIELKLDLARAVKSERVRHHREHLMILMVHWCPLSAKDFKQLAAGPCLREPDFAERGATYGSSRSYLVGRGTREEAASRVSPAAAWVLG
jgi:hypothetical protein